MKISFLPLALVFAATACESNQSDDPATGTGGATAGDSSTSGSDPTTPDPTMPDPTTPADGSTGPANGSTGPADASTGPADASTGATDTGDPVDLPFGGHLTVVVQDIFRFGFGDFYEVEYPEDRDFEPLESELPLGPAPTEDSWNVFGASPEPKDPPPAEAVVTPLAVSPQIFVDGVDNALTFELDPDFGGWFAGFSVEDGLYPGGDWSVEIPAYEAFPAGLFPDVLPGPAGDAGELELVLDANGAPMQLLWEPLDGSHGLAATIFMVGPDDQFEFICDATLADDGSADIPADCLQPGPDAPEGLDGWSVVFGHRFRADVPYADHRLRLSLEVNTEVFANYPFGPAELPAPPPGRVAPARWPGLVRGPNR